MKDYSASSILADVCRQILLGHNQLEPRNVYHWDKRVVNVYYWLLNVVQASFETPYVVRLHNSRTLSEAQPLFSFYHPNKHCESLV